MTLISVCETVLGRSNQHLLCLLDRKLYVDDHSNKRTMEALCKEDRDTIQAKFLFNPFSYSEVSLLGLYSIKI